MNKRKMVRVGALPVLFVGLVASATLQGCDEDPLAGVCCSDFEVGANLSGRFEGNVKFEAFAQAVADFAGVSAALTADVTASCKAIAVDFGEEQAPADEPADPDAAVEYWCGKAVAQINAQVQGSLTVKVQPPQCSASFSAQAKCEGGCQVDAACDPGSVDVRCDPGELSGKCEGNCSAKCEGSANLAVSCQGTCEGTCQGSCMGTCSAMDGAGQCNGACDGTCDGECRGSCTMEAGAMVQCEGECTGGCDVELKAPSCKGEITPPSCEVDADCQASCEASAEAKAECTPPSVEIVADGGLDARLLGSLKLNLPNIFLAAEARLGQLVASGEAVVNVGANFVASGGLDGTAAFCLSPIVSAMGTAAGNIEASASATVSVVGAVGG